MPPPRTTPAPSMTPLDPDTTKKIVVEYGVWATDPQSGTYDTRQLHLPFPTREECLARIAAEASETPVGQSPRRGLFGEDLFD